MRLFFERKEYNWEDGGLLAFRVQAQFLHHWLSMFHNLLNTEEGIISLQNHSPLRVVHLA